MREDPEQKLLGEFPVDEGLVVVAEHLAQLPVGGGGDGADRPVLVSVR